MRFSIWPSSSRPECLWECMRWWGTAMLHASWVKCDNYARSNLQKLVRWIGHWYVITFKTYSLNLVTQWPMEPKHNSFCVCVRNGSENSSRSCTEHESATGACGLLQRHDNANSTNQHFSSCSKLVRPPLTILFQCQSRCENEGTGQINFHTRHCCPKSGSVRLCSRTSPPSPVCHHDLLLIEW
jgi:hypothetical protein